MDSDTVSDTSSTGQGYSTTESEETTESENSSEQSAADSDESDSIDSSEISLGSQCTMCGVDPASAKLKAASTEPLYDGADITVLMAYLLLFNFGLRHRLSMKAITELLQLVAVFLPMTAKLPRSVYLLKKFLTELFPDVQPTVHGYCSFCHSLLDSPLSLCRRCDATVRKQVKNFITLPLVAQLKKMFTSMETWEALQLRFKRHTQPEVIEDVYDGMEYKRHMEFLACPSNVSLIMNTDGVAIFRSSNISLWPVWFAVNELPKHKRFLKKNMILGDLWFSSEKPPMSIFLRPIMDSLNHLFRIGFQVETPAGMMTAKVILLQSTLDLPARALVLNSKQFNGKYGCSYCEDVGRTNPGNPLHRFWPCEPHQNLRTHASILQDAREATATGSVVKGVYGASILCIHRPFNIVKGTVIDALHAVFIGVVHQLLKLWFDKANRRQEWYIGDKINLCDKRLLGIEVPDTISRVPKSLGDLAHWKGSEMRSWILFYSLPVLHGILLEAYFDHLVLLVMSLHILWGDRILRSNLMQARSDLKTFYQRFSDLYGLSKTTMNVHLLVHIADCVEDWGPLWAYSCFPFESMNREVKLLFHGSRDMCQQMAFSFVMQHLIPSVQSKLISSSSHRIQCCAESICGAPKRIKKQPLSHLGNYFIVGGVSAISPPPVVIQLLKTYFANNGIAVEDLHDGSKLQMFCRLLIGDNLFFCRNYKRVKKRNSYTVIYKSGGQRRCCKVLYYILSHGHCIAIGTKLELQTVHSFCRAPVVRVSNAVAQGYVILSVQNIEEKCLYMNAADSGQYIACFPCSLRSD